MTLRGCILGNSHLAALRFASARPGAIPAGFALDFIGSGQSGLAHTRVQGNPLLPTSPETAADFQRFGGVSEIDLGRYDFFVLVGLGLNVFALDALYRGFRCIGMHHWQRPDPTRPLISRALMAQVMLAQMRQSLNVTLAERIRSGSSAPIFLQCQPRPGLVMLNIKGKFPAFRRMRRQGDDALMAAIFEAAARNLPETYVPQPPETIADTLFTADAFCQGSVRLTADVTAPVAHPTADFLHSNADYGRIALQRLCSLAAAKLNQS